MPRPIRPWFRFYVEAFGDRKLRRLKPAQRWVWVAVLGAARESPEPGRLYVAPGLPMTLAELADYAAVTEREARAALDIMVALSMVALEGDLMVVTNWGKRQFESDNTTERTRDHRDRSKDDGGNDVGTFQPRSKERPNGGRRNTPETETETETEERGAKRAHQLPESFEPNDTNKRIAAERGLNLEAVIPQFADYHRANGNTMKDWHLALNTWLRRERVTPQNAARPDTGTQWTPMPACPAEVADDPQAHSLWVADWNAGREVPTAEGGKARRERRAS